LQGFATPVCYLAKQRQTHLKPHPAPATEGINPATTFGLLVIFRSLRVAWLPVGGGSALSPFLIMFFGCSFALSFRLSGLGCPVVAWAGSAATRPFVAAAALVPGVQWVAAQRVTASAFLFAVAGLLLPRPALVSWLVSFSGVVVVCSAGWRVFLLRALLGRPVVLVGGPISLGFGLR
jgi:hypothetical protein